MPRLSPSARLKHQAKRLVGGALTRRGLTLTRVYPVDFDEQTLALVKRVEPYTMTSPERIVAVRDAVRYVVQNDIPGDIVECGVWKGGSSMAAMLTLLDLGAGDRTCWLFDTFAGMSEPTEHDTSPYTDPAVEVYDSYDAGDHSTWTYAPIDEVREAVASTGYDIGRVNLVKGKVEETIPDRAPERIALLRLDTDWYESTKHELEHLWPRLVPGGILIIDDYGYWEGARRAVDEFVAALDVPLFLSRTDYTGRVAVKMPSR